MAKAPRPGQVKTRLVPPLSTAEATALNAAFLADITATIARLAAIAPVSGFVAYAPAGEAGRFAGLLAPGTQAVLADGRLRLPRAVSGIGRALVHATRALLAQGFAAACLVNSDSPTLPQTRLAQAVELLAQGECVVLGPAEDGGYYLIGIPATLARRAEALFRDIPWSTTEVTAATRMRAAAAGIPLVCLPPWYDIDDPAALARLVAALAPPGRDADHGAGPAPATAACLAGLDLARRLAGR